MFRRGFDVTMYHSPDSYLQTRHYQSSHEYQNELISLFNKKFHFQPASDWMLPESRNWFASSTWKVRELEGLKSKLNFYKSQLNNFDIEEWSNHTRRRNPAGNVCWLLKKNIDPEFVTQAWTKFYECAYTYDFIPEAVKSEKKIVSLHLCEAPGAFITSLNHYLKTHYVDVDWKWLANTLNPYYEGNSLSNMINDDRFMLHTLENWYFGIDSTGNLMNWENSQSIIEKVTALGKVELVTADGSIDCMQRPDAQEEVTSPLHYCEIITALQALAPGGTFLCKLFTMFEHSTVNLLYLLCNMFNEVHIYKPATSKQGNSEVYAICLQYKGSDVLVQNISILKTIYGNEDYSNKSLFPLEQIPQSFLRQVIDCARYFCDIQCQVINNNLEAYLLQKAASYQNKDLNRIKSLVANHFLYYYDLRPLSHDHEILKGILHEENKVNINPRYHRGSYTERQMYPTMTLQEKCQCIKKKLNEGHLTNQQIYIPKNDIKWLNASKSSDANIKFTYGLPLTKVNSSAFVYVPIMKLCQQILDEDDFKHILTHRCSNTLHNIAPKTDNSDKVLQLPAYNFTEQYNIYEKNCFTLLLKTLKELREGESLIVENYSALTHFNVSVLFILSTNCFSNVGFTSDCQIIFKNMIAKESLRYLDEVENECKVKKIENIDVLNFLSVKHTNVGDFFNNIVSYNNSFYVKTCKQYIRVIEQSFCN